MSIAAAKPSGGEEKQSRSRFGKKAAIGAGLAAVGLGGAYAYYKSQQLSDYDKETLEKWTATDDFIGNFICMFQTPLVFNQMLKNPVLKAVIFNGLNERFKAACSPGLGVHDQELIAASLSFDSEGAIMLTDTIAKTLKASFFTNHYYVSREFDANSMERLTAAIIESAHPQTATISRWEKGELSEVTVTLPHMYKNNHERLETIYGCLTLVQNSVDAMLKALEQEIQKVHKNYDTDTNTEMKDFVQDRYSKATTTLQQVAEKCATTKEQLVRQINPSEYL
jgi:hypothetical protein